MRFVCIALGIVTAATSPAAADTTCTYNTAYSSPFADGTCFVDAVEGCPLHVVVPHQVPLDVRPYVIRDGEGVNVNATTAIAGEVMPSVSDFDYYSCDCARVSYQLDLDELAITIPGLLAGDTVEVGGGSIVVGAAAPCEAPMWPTQYMIQSGGCDLCPEPPPDDHHSLGCSASASAGGWLALATLGILALSRRRRRR